MEASAEFSTGSSDESENRIMKTRHRQLLWLSTTVGTTAYVVYTALSRKRPMTAVPAACCFFIAWSLMDFMYSTE